MADEQLDLFSYVDRDPVKNACCVVINGKCEDLTWRELFDTRVYDTLKCVTYVSSGAFFEKSVSDFDNVTIVIGIEKGDVKRAFDESIRARMQGEGEKLFSCLSDSGKWRIIDKSLNVRYSLSNTIIHSKIYLLSNSACREKQGNHRICQSYRKSLL